MEERFVIRAKELFEDYIKTDTIKQHCIEVEAIMKFLAQVENEDVEKWAAAGLLHDLDFQEVKDIQSHAKKTVEILKKEGFPEDMIHAIAAHNEEGTGIKRESKIDYALAAADNVSGLIYAYVLIRKSIKGIEVSKVKKRMKESAFAANCRRDKINDIEKAGINLDRFLDAAIKAMESIGPELGFYS